MVLDVRKSSSLPLRRPFFFLRLQSFFKIQGFSLIGLDVRDLLRTVFQSLVSGDVLPSIPKLFFYIYAWNFGPGGSQGFIILFLLSSHFRS